MRELPLEIVNLILSYLSREEILECNSAIRSWRKSTVAAAFKYFYLNMFRGLTISSLATRGDAPFMKKLDICLADSVPINLDDVLFILKHVPNLESLGFSHDGCRSEKLLLSRNNHTRERSLTRLLKLKHISGGSSALPIINATLRLPENRLVTIGVDLSTAKNAHEEQFYDLICQAHHLTTLKLKPTDLGLYHLQKIHEHTHIEDFQLDLSHRSHLLLSSDIAVPQLAKTVKRLSIDDRFYFASHTMENWLKLVAPIYTNVETFTLGNLYDRFENRTAPTDRANINHLFHQWKQLREISVLRNASFSSQTMKEIESSGVDLTKMHVQLNSDYRLNHFLKELSSSSQSNLEALSVGSRFNVGLNTVHLLSGEQFQNLRELNLHTYSLTSVTPKLLLLLLNQIPQVKTLKTEVKIPVPFSADEVNSSFVSKLHHLKLTFQISRNHSLSEEVIQSANHVASVLLSCCTDLRKLKLKYKFKETVPYASLSNKFCIDLTSQHNLIDIELHCFFMSHYLITRGNESQWYKDKTLSHLDKYSDPCNKEKEYVIIKFENSFLMKGTRVGYSGFTGVSR